MSEKDPEPITVGSIPSAENSEIRFYVSKYKGKLYAHVRKFVKTEAYSGPTQAGVTMTRESLEAVKNALGALRPQDNVGEKELARIPRGAGLALVVRVSLYKDKQGLDFREWVESPTYTGWSKKGVRVPYDYLTQVQQFLGQLEVFFRKEN